MFFFVPNVVHLRKPYNLRDIRDAHSHPNVDGRDKSSQTVKNRRCLDTTQVFQENSQRESSKRSEIGLCGETGPLMLFAR